MKRKQPPVKLLAVHQLTMIRGGGMPSLGMRALQRAAAPLTLSAEDLVAIDKQLRGRGGLAIV